MPGLTFDVRPAGPSRLILAVTGEVDIATAPELVECLRAHADHDLVIDLSGVTFLDSSGINALLVGYRAVRDAGRTLHVTGERDNVRQVLEIAAVTKLFHDGNDALADT